MPTPNINLNLPATGSTGWDVPTNQNNTLDSYLSGGTPLPAPSVTKISAVNGVSSSGSFGVPVTVGVVSLANQTAAIAVTNILASAPAGLYRMSGYLHIQAAGTGGTINAFLGYNDGSATNSDTSGSISANSLAAHLPFGLTFRSAASQPITYSVNLSGVTGSPQYQLDILLERIA